MSRLQKRQKTAFGEFLVQEIKSAGMSQESFYNAVGIAKPTFLRLDYRSSTSAGASVPDTFRIGGKKAGKTRLDEIDCSIWLHRIEMKSRQISMR
ncbi:MAG: hypothetical protein ACLTR8_09345 [Oscillospiraceae bacterium]